jgi:hypothetical protein
MEGDSLVKSGVMLLAALTASVFWTARPQMMSFFLSCVVLYLLWLYLKRGIDRLWFIPPIFVLWGNLHGGFAIGFILMVLALIGEGARWLIEGQLSPREEDAEPQTIRPMIRIAIIGLVSAAAVSINPYGPQMLFYPFRTVGIGVLRDYILEWSSPDFHQAQAWPFIWMVLALLVTAGLSRRRLDWRDAFMTSGTAYSAFLAWRNVATFAVVAAPVLSVHLHDWLSQLGYRLNWNRAPRSVILAAANWLILAAVIGGAVFQIGKMNSPTLVEETRRNNYPVEAVAFMEREDLPQPMINSYNWGGYLIWAARDYPVYVDGRTDLYDDELLRLYLSITQGQPGWRDRLAQTGANSILIEANSTLGQLLALVEDWEQVYADDVAVIFVRR